MAIFSKLFVIYVACVVYYAQICSSKTYYACKEMDSTEDIRLEIEVDSEVNIVFSGPADVWFAYGLGGIVMDDTNAIVVSGSGDAMDYTLGYHYPGTKLTSSTTTNSDNTMSGTRYLNLTRDIDAGSDYYEYPTEKTTVDLIWAYGSISQFWANSSSYHAGRGVTTIRFVDDMDDTNCALAITSTTESSANHSFSFVSIILAVIFVIIR